MPRFCIFGHYQIIGSDDLLIPAALEALATGSWLMTFAYSYSKRRDALLSCEEYSTFQAIYMCTFLLSAVNFILLVVIIRNTLRGTIINSWPRRTLAKWLTIKACFSGVQFVVLIFTTNWVLLETHICKKPGVNTLQTVFQASWIPTLLSCYTCGSLILAGTKILIQKNKPVNLEAKMSLGHVMNTTWEKRLYKLKRSFGLESNSEFMRLGTVFSTIFYHDPEIVPSDVIASLLILGDKNHDRLDLLKNNEEKLLEALKSPDGSRCNPKPWMTVENAAHYMKYPLANYSWAHYLYTSRSALWGFLKVFVRARYIPRHIPPNFHDDNSFLCNTTAICMATRVPIEDFVYVTFYNQLYEIPFFVVLDHEKKSIVVSVRGTLSMADIITDLISFGESLSLAHIPHAQAHEGMHTSAKVLFRKLVEGENAILKQAKQKLENEVGEEMAKSYQLVLTGHSLGAGVAAICAIYMREMEEYKDLICFTFSPPGGLLSIEAARYSEDFMCSVTIENDIASRLGLASIFRFKLIMLDVIQNLDIPKHRALSRPFERFFAKLFRPTQREETLGPGHRYTWEGNPEATKMVQHFQAGVEKAKRLTSEELENHRQLYLPGCVLYITGLNSKQGPRGYFTRGDGGLYQEILMCNTMIVHHMPIVVLNSLKKLVRKEYVPQVV